MLTVDRLVVGNAFFEAFVEIQKKLLLPFLLADDFGVLGLDLTLFLAQAFSQEHGHELVKNAEFVIG
jgi:hypothetical protein